MEIYVIDANGMIIATTYPPELGLRFSAYAPYFVEYLNRIRLFGGFFPDQIVSGKATGAMKKFASMATPDHTCILELGLPVTIPEAPAFRYLDQDLTREVIADLSSEIQKCNVGIKILEMPACNADRGLPKQVCYNLIANAIRFSRTRERPQVEIGADFQDGVPVYYVRDNGIGFDMRYAQKLFRVFERLCDSGEYGGTGGGLAIVNRIIEMHGGKIWAESEPDRKATFLFMLSGGKENEDTANEVSRPNGIRSLHLLLSRTTFISPG